MGVSSVQWKKLVFYPLIAALLSAGLIMGGCATNPATGERQLNFYSESQEIKMGSDADQQISASLGLYPDQDLQKYVEDLGKSLAAKSERPQLPWTFRVLDDPTVNAFALPGGYIYVTRGILTYLSSEAELAGVVGHEIGHVTAQHSVHRMSSQQLAQLGLGIGMVLSPELQRFGQFASLGLGLLFLKFSRDDETQADELGLRYMGKESYDPGEMVEVMAMLDGVSQSAGGGRVPEWLATHPNPGNRKEHIEELMSMREGEYTGKVVNRKQYLERIDGTIFGQNPREGFFKNNVFYHPDLEFRFDFPEGWETTNLKQGVVGVSPNNDAALQIVLSDKKSIEKAADEFFTQQGISLETERSGKINGLPEITGIFRVTTDRGVFKGQATFLSYGGIVYQILGYSPQSVWSSYEGTISRSVASFNRLTDEKILSVEPMRVNIVTLDESMTFEEFTKRYPSSISVETLALINKAELDDKLQSGQLMKQVVGGVK
jgi:predicted Zn-dependent protease